MEKENPKLQGVHPQAIIRPLSVGQIYDFVGNVWRQPIFFCMSMKNFTSTRTKLMVYFSLSCGGKISRRVHMEKVEARHPELGKITQTNDSSDDKIGKFIACTN